MPKLRKSDERSVGREKVREREGAKREKERVFEFVCRLFIFATLFIVVFVCCCFLYLILITSFNCFLL